MMLCLLSEDDISTTCHDNGVLARSEIQFIHSFVRSFRCLPFFFRQRQRQRQRHEKKKIPEPSSEGRTHAYPNLMNIDKIALIMSEPLREP